MWRRLLPNLGRGDNSDIEADPLWSPLSDTHATLPRTVPLLPFNHFHTPTVHPYQPSFVFLWLGRTRITPRTADTGVVCKPGDNNISLLCSFYFLPCLRLPATHWTHHDDCCWNRHSGGLPMGTSVGAARISFPWSGGGAWRARSDPNQGQCIKSHRPPAPSTELKVFGLAPVSTTLSDTPSSGQRDSSVHAWSQPDVQILPEDH